MTDQWIPVNDFLPPLETQCIVARPNKYSGKVDVLMGYLHDSGEKGRSYGHMYDSKWLYGYYWSFPAVAPLEAVTHWMPLPEPPKTTTP